MLSRIIPRDEQFFDLFNQLAGHLKVSAQLLDQLLGATENGDVAWQETADEDIFMAELKHGFVHVEQRREGGEDGQPWTTYRAYLYDRKGRLADEVVGFEARDEGATLSNSDALANAATTPIVRSTFRLFVNSP